MAERHCFQDTADTTFIHHDKKAAKNALFQVAEPPSDNAVFSQVGALPDPLGQLRLLFIGEFGRGAACMRSIGQASDALLVIADDPVPQRLAVHAAASCRLSAIASVEHKCHSEQAPSNLGVTAAGRRRP